MVLERVDAIQMRRQGLEGSGRLAGSSRLLLKEGEKMQRYIIHRLIQMVPLLLGVSVIIYFLLSMVPGDPVDLLITANPNVKMEDVARLKHAYGLDQPIYIRYGKWLERTVTGDLGWSRVYKRPAGKMVLQRLPNTVTLMSAALLVSLLIAIPVGIYSAKRQYSFLDYIFTVLAFLGQSMPSFWFGIMLILLFAVKLHWLPPGGMMDIGVANTVFTRLKYLILPTVVLSLINVGRWARYMRSTMLEVINQDYIRTARAKGLTDRAVTYRHAFRNALIPVITLLAIEIPGLFSGATITETVFSWPGIGKLNYDSIMLNDYAVAMASIMIFAILVVFFNLVADIAYALADPRVRYE